MKPLAVLMYNMLVDIWGSCYNRYEIEIKNLGQDSSAGSRLLRMMDLPKLARALAEILRSIS
ncbi:uncharacterized protein BDCG_00180 [Blastomyces dermatitidis ER-3]|uniref:Uncharacterized protein n=2 Tax=Ajellomyces dermatitidis TaxID=5039 RepID=A0A0J9HF22_AJEDA|nr:uncharacterized protein BDCG_00180 [Blastomyces dermatitidis ER-3]KMW67629.1 hypothetical protein BDDG_12227 [Blastomyces dermatitidis ATCC 18188]OAS99324.1 hypothetical protein BDCG_00180 [Blastomyces dermatitidis ER-3]